MNKIIYACLGIAFLLCEACNIINPKEPIPTYLHLEPFAFSNPDSSFTGSSSHKITSVKIFAGNTAGGVYDLPCTVPLIISKDELVSVVPMVTNQGMKSYVTNYPFYEIDSVMLKYAPGQVSYFTPKTKYLNVLTRESFRLKINFEEGNFFKPVSGDTGIFLTNDPQHVIEGKFSGMLYMDQSHKNSECISTNYFNMPSSDCWLELEYKCSVPFQVGFRAEDNSGNTKESYSVGFYPKEEVNKVYINVSNFTNQYPGYTRVYLKIRSSMDDDNGKYKEGFIILDNFKVIYR